MASVNDFILTSKSYCLDCLVAGTPAKIEMESLDSVSGSGTKRKCPTCDGTEFIIAREQELK